MSCASEAAFTVSAPNLIAAAPAIPSARLPASDRPVNSEIDAEAFLSADVSGEESPVMRTWSSETTVAVAYSFRIASAFKLAIIEPVLSS